MTALYFTYAVIIINIILAFVLIYFEHNEPNVTWAWILVLIMLPIFGFIIYLVIGLDGKRQKVYINKQENDKKLFDEILSFDVEGLKFLHVHKNKALLKEYLKINQAKKFQRLVHLNYKTSGSVISMHNDVNLFFDGTELFDDIINEINQSTTYVHIQSYIIRNDYLSLKILTALIEATKRGVEVKILTDKIGSFSINNKKIKNMASKEIDISFFPTFTKFSMNLRNHRKVIIIDGKVGYIGGFNIGKEYLGEDKKYGNWRDAHSKINGDCAKLLEISFILDWNSTTTEEHIDIDEKYFPVIDNTKDYQNKIQIVRSGPDTKDRNIELAFTKLINTAQRSIYIVTPYFMPDSSLTIALRNAIYSGVKVHIMIPKNPDHPFVFGASISYLKELVNLGANVYGYDDGFIHSKLLIVDETVCSIGSANFDTRSFKLNFEVTAFIYNHETCLDAINQIKQDMKKSIKLTKEIYNNRSTFEKIKDSFSRLLSPLL